MQNGAAQSLLGYRCFVRIFYFLFVEKKVPSSDEIVNGTVNQTNELRKLLK